jgi:tryptophan synthase alpha chain
MNRLEQRLSNLAAKNRKALVSYIVAGDPNLDESLSAMHALVSSGVDILELGVPFSDPSAEGPVIQLGHERALANHTNMRDVSHLVKQFREKDLETPIVLMGYANPIEWIGHQNFAANAAEAGVDGVLTVDIPPEEAGDLNKALIDEGLVNIFLLAPTTSESRIKEIVELASGFLYYVSLKGTTGSAKLDIKDVEAKLSEIRKFTKLPICVGFGIKTAETAAQVARVADGVVIGSALVEIISQPAQASERTATISDYCSRIREALDQH